MDNEYSINIRLMGKFAVTHRRNLTGFARENHGLTLREPVRAGG